MDAVVLAGGLGTRLRSVVADLPKPMASVNGRPFLEHQLRYWMRQGIDRFILSVGYKHETIVAHFGAAFEGAQIEYAVEPEPLGTGGGLLLALEKRSRREGFLLLNGDTFFEVDLPALMRFHGDRHADLTICLFESDRHGRYMGITVDEEGQILSLADASPGGLANGGVYLFGADALSGIPWRSGDRVSLEDELLPAIRQRKKRLFGFRCSGRFIDIGVPEDYRRAGALLTS